MINKNTPYCSECCGQCDCNDDGFQYLVIPDAGVVKAELSDTEADAFRVLVKLFGTLSTKYVAFSDTKFLPTAIMRNSYKGSARVNFSDGDTFHEEDGIKISREKALNKYHRDFDRVLAGALTDARILCANLERYCKKNNVDTSSVPTVEDITNKRYRKI